MRSPFCVLLVGCGKMGSALAEGWMGQLPECDITIVDPNPLSLSGNATPYLSIDAVPADSAFDAVVLAVKPQSMDEACSSLKPFLKDETLILSIAAGKSLAYYETQFGQQRPIIRSMPNTPAAVGKGITVATANSHVTEKQRHLAAELLTSVGGLEWLEDESLMDAVTAVSGSGPAYVFLLMEELAKSAIDAGLPEHLAAELARKTVIGAAYLAESAEDVPPATLRQQVTSPGGTTAAALHILMDNNQLGRLLSAAVKAARDRGRALGQS